MIGRWLRDLGDDCAALARIILDAADTNAIDPLAWIAAAVQRRKKPKYRNGFLQMIADEGMQSAHPADHVTAFLESQSDACH